jgi:hypothetical protein
MMVLRGRLNTRRKMGCQGWISFGCTTPRHRAVVRAVAGNYEGNGDVPGSETLPAQLPNSG